MKAIILAAGKGTRMLPLTLTKPKPLLEVLGKPLLTHILEALPPEITEVILVVGYKGKMIRDYFGAEFAGRKITYLEQKELNGHVPALNLARLYLKDGERFFFTFADDIYDPASFERLLKHPRAVLAAPVEHPERFGIVVQDDEGNIEEIEEKPAQPKSNLAVTGTYLFDTHIFDYEAEKHANGEYYLPPVVQKMVKDYPMAVERASLWIPIGYPEDLAKAEAILRARRGF